MDEIKKFDDLPDDAVVPRRVTAAVLHMSERTVRRSVPTVKLSARRRGNRSRGHSRDCARRPYPGSDLKARHAQQRGRARKFFER